METNPKRQKYSVRDLDDHPGIVNWAIKLSCKKNGQLSHSWMYGIKSAEPKPLKIGGNSAAKIRIPVGYEVSEGLIYSDDESLQGKKVEFKAKEDYPSSPFKCQKNIPVRCSINDEKNLTVLPWEPGVSYAFSIVVEGQCLVDDPEMIVHNEENPDDVIVHNEENPDDGWEDATALG